MDDDLLRRPDAVERALAVRETTLDGRAIERVPLDAVAGRTLAEAVVAEHDVPPHSHATMDGFAFAAGDDPPLSIVAEVAPEDDPPEIDPGEAVRIATGAPLPDRANGVAKIEDATVEDGRLRPPATDPGTYTYERGSNVAAGERLFDAGERLGPKDAILLRDLGIESVPVHERLSAGLLATGSEIHEGRSADLDSAMLAGLIRSWGGDAALEGSVPDDYDRVEARVAALGADHDVVVTTGGTSVGRKDYSVRTLDALGEIDFHGVRIRPGKPVAVARLPEHDAVAVAIPGKPVGALTATLAVARPLFAGEHRLPTVPATLARDVGVGREGFEYWVPVLLDDENENTGADGTGDTPPGAMPLGHADSPLPVYQETFDPSVLSSSTRATRADGFFLMEESTRAGETVGVVPYSAV
jgi:molybdopterin molybdotransferase